MLMFVMLQLANCIGYIKQDSLQVEERMMRLEKCSYLCSKTIEVKINFTKNKDYKQNKNTVQN